MEMSLCMRRVLLFSWHELLLCGVSQNGTLFDANLIEDDNESYSPISGREETVRRGVDMAAVQIIRYSIASVKLQTTIQSLPSSSVSRKYQPAGIVFKLINIFILYFDFNLL